MAESNTVFISSMFCMLILYFTNLLNYFIRSNKFRGFSTYEIMPSENTNNLTFPIRMLLVSLK